jgi:peroxiredoxin
LRAGIAIVLQSNLTLAGSCIKLNPEVKYLIGGKLMAVEIGDMAPDFELSSHNGNKVKLSDFRGKKNVFIAFYPLAWTPV